MSNDKPVVSVIVPCYNQGEYVQETLESVRVQTYPNLECIIVNDGSTDNSLQEVQTFCLKDDRFRCFDKKNEGVSAARNFAISHSRGDFILPLDADDKIAPTYLEEALKIFSEDPSVKLVYSGTYLFGAQNKVFDLPEYSYQILLGRNHIVCTAMYRKSDFLKTGGYNKNMVNGWEDWDFWLSLLTRDDKVIRIKKELFYYRIKRTSRTSDANSHFRQLRKQIWDNHRDVYANNFLDPTECEEYRRIKESLEYKLGCKLLNTLRKILRFLKLR